MVLPLNKLEFPSPKDALYVVGLVEIGQVVLEKIFFLISSIYFRYFVIIDPWKRAGPLICTNLSPLHQRMHCAKFG